MDRKRKDSSPKRAGRRFAPYRGSISGSGAGMSDEQALAILREVESGPGRQSPDIEVVVGTEPVSAQTEMSVGPAPDDPEIGWTVRKIGGFGSPITRFAYSLPDAYPSEAPRVVISKADLRSPIRSVLDQGKALRLVEDALGQGESLRMRLLMDKSTIDIQLSGDVSDGLEASLSDLIDRSLD